MTVRASEVHVVVPECLEDCAKGLAFAVQQHIDLAEARREAARAREERDAAATRRRLGL
jgi:hypothetical protein